MSDYHLIVEEELILVVSRNDDEAKAICQRISDKLRKKGLESSGPLVLSKVHITEAKRVVLDAGRTADDDHDWLKDVKRATIEDLGDADSQMVKGYSFRFRRRINNDGEGIVKPISETSVATIIQTTRIKKSVSNTANTPFSYDPAQEFVTEL